MVVLVGFGGQMASEYLPALRSLCAPIEAACEPDPSKESTLSSLGIKRYAKVSELPGPLRALPVIVAVPHFLTPTIVNDLLGAGFRRILIEKPPALTTSVLQSVGEQISRFNADVYVASKRRFSSAYNAARLSLNATSKPAFVSIRLHRCFNRDDRNWRSSIDKAGEGVLFDLGYHAVDLVHWLTSFDQSYRVETFSTEGAHYSPPNWSRAKFRIVFSDRSVVFEIDVDRVAPSPFEQLIIDTENSQQIFNSRRLLDLDKESGQSSSREFETAATSSVETAQMLSAFLSNREPVISTFEVHSVHLQTIEAALGRHNFDE